MGAGEGNRRDERLLPSGCELLCVLCSLRSDRAGQGAHREVGSEGFEAYCRAVAAHGEPVGQIQAIPSLDYGGQEVPGSLDAARCLRAARRESNTRYPGTHTVLARRGRVPGRISRKAKSLGMPCEKSEWRTVLGTGESKSPGIVPSWGGGMGPKGRRPGGRVTLQGDSCQGLGQ